MNDGLLTESNRNNNLTMSDIRDYLFHTLKKKNPIMEANSARKPEQFRNQNNLIPKCRLYSNMGLTAA